MSKSEKEPKIGATALATSADDAFSRVLSGVLAEGHDVKADRSLSVGSQKTFREILQYTLLLEKPRERLVWNPKRRLNLPGAVARFVWMMGANDRLKDIEYYWGSKISPFSDDGILVPGSSYGHRMLNPSPGLNQVRGVIDRLKEDAATRRAAIAVYQAEDTVRSSRDIPCTFGLSFHIRDGVLYPGVIMRSNNAFILLPYNLFEFSLLAEAIAVEVGVRLGTMSYFAMSMHVFSENHDLAQEVTASPPAIARSAVPEMPGEPAPMKQIQELVKLEAEARHQAAGFSEENFDEWLNHGESRLNAYWRQYYYLLLLHMALKNGFQHGLTRLREEIQAPWKEYLPTTAFTVKKSSEERHSGQQGLLFSDPSESSKIQIDLRNSIFHSRLRSLEELCCTKSQRLVEEGQPGISVDEFALLRTELVGDWDDAVAFDARELPKEISQPEVDKLLGRIRQK